MFIFQKPPATVNSFIEKCIMWQGMSVAESSHAFPTYPD